MGESSVKKSMSIQLLIKSPNQVEDLIVDCDLSWSIGKLKDHLSDAYPTKPLRSQQKLIYSGRLLPDHLLLKDFLTQDQSVQTMHLVCPHLPNFNEDAKSSVKSETSEVKQPDTTASTNHTNEAPSTPLYAEGLRQRLLGQPQMPNPSGVFGSQVPFPDNMSGMSPVPPPYMAYQLALMQQTYAQAMAQHYAQNIPGSTPLNFSHLHWNQYSNGQPTQLQNTSSSAEGPTPNANQQNTAERRPARNNEDEEEEVDMLDAAYVFTRVMMLLLALYFYSSPWRVFLFMVLIFGIIMYRVAIRRRNRRVNRRNAAENNSEDSPQAERQNDQEGQAVQNEPPVQVGDSSSTPIGPSVWAIAVTFVKSFFISLVPEPLPA